MDVITVAYRLFDQTDAVTIVETIALPGEWDGEDNGSWGSQIIDRADYLGHWLRLNCEARIAGGPLGLLLQHPGVYYSRDL